MLNITIPIFNFFKNYKTMNLNELRNQYRLALLNQDADSIAELEAAFLDAGGSPRDVVMQKEWADKAKPLIEKAKQLKKDNFSLNSLEFDQLDQQAKDYGPPLPAYIRGLMRGNVPTAKISSGSKSGFTGKLDSNCSKLDIPKDVQKEFKEFKKIASWDGSEAEEKRSVLAKRLILQHPEMKEKVNLQLKYGKKFRQCNQKAYELGKTNKPKEELDNLIDEIVSTTNYEKDIVKKIITKQYDTGKATLERSQEAKEEMEKMKDNPNVIKVVTPSFVTTVHGYQSVNDLELLNIHQNFISQLAPDKQWTVVIDDTGDDFTNAVFKKKTPLKGKIVAVLIPSGAQQQLPVLPEGFHASKSSLADIRTATDAVLSSSCGVLGITAQSMHKINGDLWYVTLETLIDLILRLLPVDGPTHLDIYAEQKGDFDSKQSTVLKKTCDVSLNRLFRTNPRRAEQISISAHFIEKEDNKWNGYADAVAFTWGGSTASLILKQSGWNGTCLLGTNPDQIRYCIDSLERSEPLSEREWDELINSSDTDIPNSLANVLLTIQGKEAAADQNLWNKYLDHVQNHLYSKAIEMGKLNRQIAWLKSYMPDEANFSPRMRLLWLTTQLAQANHLGQTDMISVYQKEFEDLCTLIYPEDAPLTCLTCLHVAVAYMNDFNFKTAYDVVKDWIGKDEAIPGRQYYGQVLSTIGQLNAFIGNQEKAVEACCAAIDKFEKLTNASEMVKDINQTSSFKVIAMMDSDPVPENMTTELEKYLGRTLEEAADQFAVSANEKEFYMHHIFLRYLVHVNTPELKPIIEKYLSHKTEWKTGQFHPWEMILFYRALLQTDIADRKAYLDQAYKQVPQVDDGTLKAIACVILGGLYYYDRSRKEELEELTQKVIDMLPYLGKQRVATLKNQLETPVEPLTLAKAVLPFNFR